MTTPVTALVPQEGHETRRSVWTDEQIALVTRTVAKGATPDELQLFLHICQRTGLDPFAKQIHAVKRWDKKANREVMTVQTGIDGYRLAAERTGKYAPGREPTYVYGDGQTASPATLVSATAYVKKMTDDGTWHEVPATAFWSEYVQQFYDKQSNKWEVSKFWKQMPHNQLAKCAEALALRRAFPMELSGLYTFDEMAQADNGTEQVSGSGAPPALMEPRRKSEAVTVEVGHVAANETFSTARDRAIAAAQAIDPDPDPDSIERAGEPEPESRVLNQREIGSLMGLVKKSTRTPEEFVAWIKERFVIESRKELRLSWLEEITKWLAGEDSLL